MAYVRAVYRASSANEPRGRPVRYEVRYRDSDGVQRTKGGFRRKRDAEAFATNLESSRHQGALIPHSHGSIRFDEVAAAWFASIEGRRRPKTLDGYQKLLNHHVVPAFGARRIGSVTYADVDRFVRELEAGGRRPGTVRNAFFVVKMVFDYGIKDGRIRVNPCAGVELPSPRSPDMLFLSAREVRTLAAAIDERWVTSTRVRKRETDVRRTVCWSSSRRSLACGRARSAPSESGAWICAGERSTW